MLTVHKLSKTYGITSVLVNISFSINPEDKIGLVGPNGCGKTTLLRILAGLEKANAGSFHFDPPTLRPGYLPQGGNLPEGITLGDYLVKVQGNQPDLTRRLEILSEKLVRSPESNDLQQQYDNVLNQLTSATESTSRTPALLDSFGLNALPLDLPLSALSGGQKTRLNLASLLLRDPSLLLLDEPTNHLDMNMLEWLENWLISSRCGAIIVSHDRVFLDRVTTTTFDLDASTHQIAIYPGNYSTTLAIKEDELTRRWQEYTDQQLLIQQLKNSARHLRGIATFRKGGKADTGDKFAKAFFANRSLATVKRAKNIETRVERLLNEDHIDKPHDSWQMKMEFRDIPESSRSVLTMENLAIGYGKSQILSGLNGTIRFGERIALTGENGCGKTTLLRTIAGLLRPLSGRCQLGASIITGFLTQEQENLEPETNALTSIQSCTHLPETEARSYLHKFLFSNDEVFIPVRVLSWGQRVRLSLACLVIGGCNFLLLDEPLSHLDIPSRNQFEVALSDFPGTILAVTHDRYFISRFANQVWHIENGILERSGAPKQDLY